MRALIVPLVLMLAACSSNPQTAANETDFALVYPETTTREAMATGSIFDNGVGLYPSRRIYMSGAVHVGDIITVILSETAQASRSSALSTERESENSVLGADQASALFPGSSFFNNLPANEAAISSNGSGSADQSASLQGSISAVVVDVMQNGNLVIVGEKRLTLTEGSEIIRVRGVIRPEDVQPNNTVLSRRIANAQISYSGSGDLARAMRPGWGTKILMGVWPF